MEQDDPGDNLPGVIEGIISPRQSGGESYEGMDKAVDKTYRLHNKPHHLDKEITRS